MRLPAREAAVIADPNASTRIIVYGRGSIDVLRAGRVFHLNDDEVAKLVAVQQRFVAGERFGKAENVNG